MKLHYSQFPHAARLLALVAFLAPVRARETFTHIVADVTLTSPTPTFQPGVPTVITVSPFDDVLTGDVGYVSCSTILIDKESIHYIGSGYQLDVGLPTKPGVAIVFDHSVTVFGSLFPAEASQEPGATCATTTSSSSSVTSTGSTTSTALPTETQPNVGSKLAGKKGVTWAAILVAAVVGFL